MRRKNEETNRISFLNTYIDSVTAKEARHILDRLLLKDGYHYIATPNTDIIIKMQKDRQLKRICEKADLILTDGEILVKLSRWLGTPIKERVCMTDFVWEVMDLAEKRGYQLFFFGGKEAALKKAVKTVRTKHPRLKIAGMYSPPLGFENDKNELERINKKLADSGADILIVFLGCPKQEKFIFQNKENYRIPVSIPMGGCVDFLAGTVKRAPIWMQKAGFEWFFRFCQEPKRMFRRYFIDDMKIFGLALHYYRRKRNGMR